MVSPLELFQHRPGGTGKLKGQKVNTQANLPTGNVFSMDWSTGKLVPITAAGLLPVGAVVTYEDRANPRRRYVVTAAAFDQYGHGQNCTCEDVLEQLKAAGFRWSRFSSCWYKTASDTALDVAARVAGLGEDQRRAIADRMSDAHHAAGARGMEEACGIA